MEYKVILGTVAVIITLVAYIPYFKDIFRGKTKPHAFSWLVWASLTGIAFFGQLFDKGGAGAWATGVTAAICISIFLLALQKGEKKITLSDKLSLSGAGIALLLWYLTNSPLGSVILIIIIDTLGGFYPTIRKSYSKPHEETLLTYSLGVIKWVIAIFALQNYSLVTVLYPVAGVFMTSFMVGLLLIRRRQYHQRVISK